MKQGRERSQRKSSVNRGLRMRKATIRDLDTLIEQRHRMFEELHHRTKVEHRIGDRSYRTFMVDMFRKKRFAGFLFVNRNGDAVAGGCVWLREVQPYPGRFAWARGPYLMSMYTSPEFRGLGLATKIIKEAMKWSKERGFERMSLHASRMGRKVYKKMGWERSWEMRISL